MTKQKDKKNGECAPPWHKPVLRQFHQSALGEITAFSIAIGAVYLTEKLLPKQTENFISGFAKKLGSWRGASAESQAELARNIVDVGIMNVAGAGSLAVQYGMRRAHQPEGEKTPLWYEGGRLAVGRMAGTVTAVGAIALMTTKAPGTMKSLETGLAEKIGAGEKSQRFAKLLVSNAVQATGAIAGNAPAQLLYDHLVSAPKKTATPSIS